MPSIEIFLFELITRFHLVTRTIQEKAFWACWMPCTIKQVESTRKSLFMKNVTYFMKQCWQMSTLVKPYKSNQCDFSKASHSMWAHMRTLFCFYGMTQKEDINLCACGFLMTYGLLKIISNLKVRLSHKQTQSNPLRHEQQKMFRFAFSAFLWKSRDNCCASCVKSNRILCPHAYKSFGHKGTQPAAVVMHFGAITSYRLAIC